MIGGNKDENGLYLGKFETRDEAKEYIKKLANRYRYAPNQKRISIRKIVAEEKEKGYRLNRTSLGNWFRELGVEIRDIRVERGQTRETYTFSLSKEILEEIEPYPNRSYLAELGLRIVTRMPIEDIVLFFPEEDDGTQINAIFEKTNKGKVKLQVTGKLNNRDRKQLRQLLEIANNNGLDAIKDYSEMMQLKYYGGYKVNEKS